MERGAELNMAWKNESRRHALASKGIKTGTKTKPVMKVPLKKDPEFSESIMNNFVCENNHKFSLKDGKIGICPICKSLGYYRGKEKSKENIWEALPTRSWSVNPKEIFVKTYRKGNIYIYHRTFPENNRIEVWKENRATKRIYPTKSFKDNYEEYTKSMKLIHKMMGKNKQIKYV